MIVDALVLVVTNTPNLLAYCR